MKTFFCALFSLISFGLFGQTGTYEVVETNNVTNIDEYELAMDKANFDAYRYNSKRRALRFESGVIIELLSADELRAKKIEFNEKSAQQFDPSQKESSYIWRLAPNGYILQVFEKSEKTESKRK